MVIEVNDYFMVTRGFLYNMSAMSLFGESPCNHAQVYDRSHEGCLYQAMEVCGPLIAAKLVAVSPEASYKKDRMGKTISLNTTELDVMTVSQKFADSMLSEENKSARVEDD